MCKLAPPPTVIPRRDGGGGNALCFSKTVVIRGGGCEDGVEGEEWRAEKIGRAWGRGRGKRGSRGGSTCSV